jgi:hypothetical protein
MLDFAGELGRELRAQFVQDDIFIKGPIMQCDDAVLMIKLL